MSLRIVHRISASSDRPTRGLPGSRSRQTAPPTSTPSNLPATTWRSFDGGATCPQGTEEQVIDLGASADQPSRVYATTPDGLKVSEDGGVNYNDVPKAPLLSHLDVLPGEVLVGVGADGKIHTSQDGGKTFATAFGSAG
ncbi:WD40/YVTN/BNR-like repeat-containing protein [Nonomuraea angiospora]